jgi:hypothetical protein
VLDDVRLVDVAPGDRCPNRLDRAGVAVVVPASLPLSEAVAPGRRSRRGSGLDPAGEQRERAGLRRRGRIPTAERVGEAVAEVEVGDDAVAAPEALGVEELLERVERARGGVELERQRRRPRVSR